MIRRDRLRLDAKSFDAESILGPWGLLARDRSERAGGVEKDHGVGTFITADTADHAGAGCEVTTSATS